MRDTIIAEVKRLANELGRPPGQGTFSKFTGIGERQWRGLYWSRWSDVLRDAGCEPNTLQPRMETGAVLAGIISACRHFGHVPTGTELQLLRRSVSSVPHPNVVRAHLGTRVAQIQALERCAIADPALADILEMVESAARAIAAPVKSNTQQSDGYVYLIKSGPHYKIGRSDDVERRLKQITVALPAKADLFHVIRTDDPAGIETYWHRRFADKWTNGEWFALSADDIRAFRRRTFQ